MIKLSKKILSNKLLCTDTRTFFWNFLHCVVHCCSYSGRFSLRRYFAHITPCLGDDNPPVPALINPEDLDWAGDKSF
jgi:hypothetical protein